MRETSFLQDEKSQSAVIHRSMVIGEAAKGLPKTFRAANSSVPWSELAGMRDRLIHGYRAVRIARVWETVRDDLPNLRSAIAPHIPPAPPAA